MNKSLLVAALLAAALATPAWAKGGSSVSFSSGRSFSSSSFSRPSTPSYTYRAPSVAPKVAPSPTPSVVQKNVTVQQNVTHVTQSSSSGGGFMSSMFGSFAGAGIANWLFAPKAAPAPAPTQQVDCTLQQNKGLAICQPAQPIQPK